MQLLSSRGEEGAASNDAGGGAGSLTYYGQIRPILAAKCTGCHAAGSIAPFTLTSLADVTAHLAATRDAVSSNYMPPWLLDDACAPYQDSGALTPAQKQMILDWIDAGGPAGDPAAAGADDPATAAPVPVDAEITMPAPYMPQLVPDEYRCFLLDWPETALKYIVNSGVSPGNPAIVHHVAVSVLSASTAATYAKKDGSDGHPGFGCGIGEVAANQSVSGWRPGQPPMSAPSVPPANVVGYPVAAGSKLLLQMHYHTEVGLDRIRPDQTTLVFHLADKVDRVAIGLPFADPVWALVPKTMLIPAGQADTAHTYVADPNLLLAVATKSVSHPPLSLYGGAMHMHLRGTRMQVRLVHADGSDQCLFNVPRWDPSWGATAFFQKPIPLQPGDKISLECHWDNTAANQPLINGVKQVPKDIVWGENRDDEMCVVAFKVAPP